MSRIITMGGRSELPTAPYEIQEEVEKYARESGRTAKLHYIPNVGWMARFSLRPNDKRMVLWQEGRAPEPPTEDVFFHRPHPEKRGEFIPMDIRQMGASGVRRFLERGNMWSGRGVHNSPVEARRKARDRNEADRQKLRREAKEEARDMVKDTRRSRLKIPYHTVGIDLQSDNEG